MSVASNRGSAPSAASARVVTSPRHHVQGFRGHRDLVAGLAFRPDTGQLFSAAYDRAVKVWSVPDRAYVDSLFGHQAEVTAIDAPRKERCVTAGADRSVRLWKIAEESQLIYRASAAATDCVRCGVQAPVAIPRCAARHGVNRLDD